MSRIGKQPVNIPDKVTVSVKDNVVVVKGPKGELSKPFPKEIGVVADAKVVNVTDLTEVKDAAGKVVEVRCTYDPATRGGDAPDGRKVKGTIHWVAEAQAVRGLQRHLRDSPVIILTSVLF